MNVCTLKRKKKRTRKKLGCRNYKKLLCRNVGRSCRFGKKELFLVEKQKNNLAYLGEPY